VAPGHPRTGERACVGAHADAGHQLDGPSKCPETPLGLTDDEAYSRVVAARTARRFPVVLDLLAAGHVSLTTIRLLAGQLTAENHPGVLESARGKR
jgi:hypothetical protein